MTGLSGRDVYEWFDPFQMYLVAGAREYLYEGHTVEKCAELRDMNLTAFDLPAEKLWDFLDYPKGVDHYIYFPADEIKPNWNQAWVM